MNEEQARVFRRLSRSIASNMGRNFAQTYLERKHEAYGSETTFRIRKRSQGFVLEPGPEPDYWPWRKPW